MSLYLVSVKSKFTSNPMELFQSVKSLQKLEADLSLTELNRVLGELYPQSVEAQTEFNSKNIKVWGMDLDRVKDSGFSVLCREFETWWILVDFSNTKMIPVKRDVLISGILD
jgi:hypothetical protein